MKKNIYFIFAVLFGITLTACNMQHECTWGEYQYNESEHWRTYTCGHTAPNNNTSHIDDNDDGNCDICNYKIPESHTHTWTWYIEDIGHIKTFTCGCPSEEGTTPHFDNDNNNLCDTCGYSMLKETPTGTFKLNIIDEQNYIYDKPEKTTMFAPGTTILFHSLPIMDADLVMYVNDAYYSKQSIVEINDEYVWEYSFVMPINETTIKFEIETLGNDKNDSDVVRTKISMFGAPSLPYYISLEVGKEHDLTDDNDIVTNVYLGHAIHIYKDIIYFPDTTIYREDIEKYSFVLKVNYDNNIREEVFTEEEIDYLDYSYIVETEDLYDGETYNGTMTTYKKYHSIVLNKENFVNDYGFINVELYIVDVDGNESIVVNEALYYSVVDNKVIFGLVSNPYANEGDKGIITEGWTYED